MIYIKRGEELMIGGRIVRDGNEFHSGGFM